MAGRTVCWTQQDANEEDGEVESWKSNIREDGSTNHAYRQRTEALLGLVSARASRTLSSTTQGGRDPYAGRNMDNERNSVLSVNVGGEAATKDILDATFTRAQSTLIQDAEPNPKNVPSTTRATTNRSYLSNPSVYPTALAHSLWEAVIRPNEDTIIDATCGNGKDALAISSMLFTDKEIGTNNDFDTQPELICVDIQQQACQNTLQSLQEHLSPETMERVSVYHTSHAPLPQPQSNASVGLICYNLGYLPGSDDKDAFTTQMVTTIYSLADAALMLRKGGLLSVMTYPGSSLLEAMAVQYFCEGLAMFTAREGWKEFGNSIPSDQVLEGLEDLERETFSVRDIVWTGLERVYQEGESNQTWRSFDHRPLGRPLSPILVTANRIK